MTSPATQFFSIPELFQALVPLLSNSSIVALAQVNHNLNEIYTPLIYQTISFRSKPATNVFDSLGSLDKSFRYACKMKLEENFCGPYSRSLKSFEEQYHQTSQPSSPLINTHQLLPLSPPRMNNLTQLQSYGSFLRQADVSYDYYSGDYLVHLCRILQFCPRIVDLSMHDVPIHDEQDILLIGRAISGLDSLRDVRLNLHLCRGSTLKSKVFSPIFFALPSGVEALNLALQNYRSSDIQPVTSNKTREVTVEQLRRRQEPLCKLRSWFGLETAKHDLQTITALLSHCPELERLEVPEYLSDTDIPEIATVIATSCPKLKHIHHWYSGQDPLAVMLITLITAMAQDTLVTLEYGGAEDENHKLGTSLQRHFGSLKSVIMRGCYHMESTTIQTILAGCRELEELTIEGGYDPCEIRLADAVAQQWASKKIRRLLIEINIGDMEELRKETFYSRRLPIVFTDTEADRMRQLKRLYQQVGSLLELEDLNLRITVPVDAMNGQDNYLCYRNVSFPGLMALPDEEAGRPGYLHLLAGLKNLKTLQGSFSADTEETKLTIDQGVCTWIHQHWPRLEKIAFFSRGTTLTAPFQWLVDQRANNQTPLDLFE
ncbi:hypothetical protein K457DRAFT_153956 [Linnemannia elongata AG-77]|uniref:F-box domain-containing protein n=1 Tax=Linnemannia elongata AG-77 TaxID=1314771 RepID=A0A197K489_9FUNG|nr:hypothetical protein K457DRAFT_153956 [Linnemannia elongata AG-77]